MLKINLPYIGVSESVPTSKLKVPPWKNASVDEETNFANILQEKLAMLPLPESLSCSDVMCIDPEHSRDRDIYVLNIMHMLIETTFQCLPVQNVKPKTKTTLLLGWKEKVQP